MMIKITNIKIENYRQYLNQNFEFSSSNNRELFIIIAKNGVGKSNFLNAITWCLYNKEVHLQDKEKALPIVNISRIRDSMNNDKVEVVVDIQVKTDENEYEINRTAVFKKIDDNESVLISDDLTVSFSSYDPILGYPNMVFLDGENAIQKINLIFPEAISQYFFFDNEQMENYFATTGNKIIKNAVYDISGITKLQKLNFHLGNIYDEYTRKIALNNPNLEATNREYEEKLLGKNEAIKKVDLITGQLDKIEQELKDLNAYILNQPDVSKIEIELEQSKIIRDNLKNDYYETTSKIYDFIYEYTWKLRLYNQAQIVLKYIDEKESNKQLPPPIDTNLLRRVLNEELDKCPLCAGEVTQHSIDHITHVLNENDLTNDSGKILISVRNDIRRIIQDIDNFETKRDSLLTRRKSIVEKQATIDDTIKRLIDDEKTVSNKTELLNKIDERKQLETRKEGLLRNQGMAIHQRENAITIFNEIEKKRDDAFRKLNLTSDLKKLVDFADSIKRITKKAEKDIIGSIRNEISEKTYEQFSKLIWKEKTYKGVEVTDDYQVDLIHKDGYRAIGSTSAAERSLLALAFTNAMHEVSGFESPLVIDSPVGRVSDVNRKKFAEVLSELSLEKQLIILFTPDEYSNDISDVFDGVANKYMASLEIISEDFTTVKKIGDD